MALPKFAKMVRLTLQEKTVVTLANWAARADRPDLMLVLYTLADSAGIFAGDRIPKNHQQVILAEYPSAFDSNISIYFNVTIEKDGE